MGENNPESIDPVVRSLRALDEMIATQEPTEWKDKLVADLGREPSIYTDPPEKIERLPSFQFLPLQKLPCQPAEASWREEPCSRSGERLFGKAAHYCGSF